MEQITLYLNGEVNRHRIVLSFDPEPGIPIYVFKRTNERSCWDVLHSTRWGLLRDTIRLGKDLEDGEGILIKYRRKILLYWCEDGRITLIDDSQLEGNQLRRIPT